MGVSGREVAGAARARCNVQIGIAMTRVVSVERVLSLGARGCELRARGLAVGRMGAPHHFLAETRPNPFFEQHLTVHPLWGTRRLHV